MDYLSLYVSMISLDSIVFILSGSQRGCTGFDSRVAPQKFILICGFNTIFFSSVCFQFYMHGPRTLYCSFVSECGGSLSAYFPRRRCQTLFFK